MSKLFNPADYNPTANPSLPRTNSPWRFWAALVFCGLALWGAWLVFAPKIRVAKPKLDITGERVVVSTVATNDTSAFIGLRLRFSIGRKSPANDASPARFLIMKQREMEVAVPGWSEKPVTCDFPLPAGRAPFHAEVEIVSWQKESSRSRGK